MNWLQGVLIGFGALNIILGAEAMIAKGSVVSLVAATGVGAIAIAGAFVAKNNSTVGYIMGGVSAVLILGRFAKTFLQDPAGKLYPAGVLTFAAILTLVCLAIGHFTLKK